MKNTDLREVSETPVTPEIDPATTLEKSLDEAVLYGKPTLACYNDRTWSATLGVWINEPNAAFEITSGFSHPSARDALAALVLNARRSLKSLGALR